MKGFIKLILLTITFAYSASLKASNLYGGLGLGQAKFETDYYIPLSSGNEDIEDDSVTTSLILGYYNKRNNEIDQLTRFEVAYNYIGEWNFKSEMGNFNEELTSLSVSWNPTAQLTPSLSFTVKIAYHLIDSDFNGDIQVSQAQNDDLKEFSFGLGVEYSFNKNIFVRFDYDEYDIDYVNLSTSMLVFGYKF